MENYVGIYHGTYDSGIGIIDFVGGDYVIFQHFYGEHKKRVSKAKLRYNAKGEDYFISYGVRYYLSDFMRIRFK